MENPSTAAEWLAQFSEGELAPRQKAAFTEWLRESPTHVREILEVTLLRQDLGALPISRDQLAAWTQAAQVAARAGVVDGPFSGGELRVGRMLLFRKWSVVAASFAAICMIAVATWWLTRDERYVTGLGEQQVITLSDGSVVSLNTESRLEVNFSEHARSIELLEGEAFFRVSRDPTRPFEVSARDATIRALGTQFNVRIAPAATVVSVADGAVEVRSLVNSRDDASAPPALPALEPIQLKKGEEALIAGNEPVARVQHVPVSRATAWTRGRVEFEATALQDVLAEFQRYRKLDVHIEEEAIRQLKLTGSFDAHDLDSALAYIDSLPQIGVEKTAPDAFVIRHEAK